MMTPIPGARSDNGQPNIFGDMKQFTARGTGHPGEAINQMLKSPDSDMEQVDPDALMNATVRPNNNWGGMPAGSVVPVTRREFEGNRACLATAEEYARILAVEASPHTQADHRALQERQAAQREATRGGFTPEERAKIEALQKQARADAERNQALQEEIRQAARARLTAAPPPPRTPATSKELDAAIAKKRAEHEAATAHLGSHYREKLDAILEQEIAELTALFHAEEEQRRAAARAQVPAAGPRPESGAAAVPPEDQLRRLKSLHAEGLLTDHEYATGRAVALARLVEGR